MAKCAITGVVGTGKPCTNEGVVQSPYSGKLVCARCARDIDDITVRLNLLIRASNANIDERPLIAYDRRN